MRQYLQAGLVDEVHLALTPTLLGSGEALLAGIDLRPLGFECTRHVATRERAPCRVDAALNPAAPRASARSCD